MPSAIKVSAGYGRLYVAGPAFRIAHKLPGAALNDRRQVVEVSLTLETLRELRKITGMSPQEFAQVCTPEVLAWARAASGAEKAVAALHAKLETGWRMEFPWYSDEPDRPPYDHQTIMASVACSVDGCSYIADMGTGKTRAAAEAIRHMLETKRLDAVIVFCPRGVIGTWRRQIAQWTQGLTVVPLIEMPIKDRAAILAKAPCQSEKMVYVVNYDVAYKLESTIKALAKVMKIGVVLDEGHKIRNPQAKVSKAIVQLAQVVDWRLHMTGSPILQGAHDVWSQWYVVDLGITFGANYVQFKREFFDENKFGWSIDPKEGTLDEIGKRMRRRGLRFTKADCLDLPPKVYETVEVEMGKEQTRAYKEMEAELIAMLEGANNNDPDDDRVATAANQLVAILRLTTITSGFVKDVNDQIYRFDPNPKLDALEEIVDENIGQQQIIVWARYRENHDAICTRLARHNPRLIRGGVSQADRDDTELGFQEGRYRLLVGQQGAGGIGLNLFAASLAVYYSQGHSLEHRLQSEDRCHRAGSERHNKVTYLDMVATYMAGSIVKPTADHVVVDSLAGKKDVAHTVMDLKRLLGIAA